MKLLKLGSVARLYRYESILFCTMLKKRLSKHSMFIVMDLTSDDIDTPQDEVHHSDGVEANDNRTRTIVMSLNR